MLSKLLPLSLGLSVLKGVPSTDDQDATVMMVHVNPAEPKQNGLCTAVLVAPNLVLTARHCVAVADAVVGCKSDGTPLEGAGIRGDFEPQNIYVFTGKTRPAFTNFLPTPNIDTTRWTPAARGVRIVHDGSGTLCSHDIALVVLDKPVNAPIASIRLDRDPEEGEPTISVGWGVTSSELEPSVRQQRRDVPVRRLGPNDSYPVLTKTEFLTTESICLGDSGGPIFSQKTSAVIGIVSRGGNGTAYDPKTPGSTCTEADNFNTKLSPFKETINQAFTAAGASPKLEPAPEEDGCHVSAVGLRGRAERGAFGLVLGLLGLVRRRLRKR